MYRALVTIVCLALPSVAIAEDRWSDPAPGVRRLHRTTANQNINAVVVDLCAAGISIRATAASERGRTVDSFGAMVGATVAVNADFFGSGFSTDGPSRSGGAPWGGGDHGYVAPLAFGPHRVALARHEETTGVPDWAQEVVSGHPSIVVDGAYRNNDGDSLCSNRHPRTAAGLSADRKRLILAVVDGRATTRIGMTCGELASLMQELGAHDAVNLDGGGSSTMWLGNGGIVNRPSDGSPRTVANHLAVIAKGSGDAPFCPSQAPRGYLDTASCEQLVGWAQDADVPDGAASIEVWADGPPGSDAPHFTATADVHRDDLCDAIGSCAHGFAIPTPANLRDGKPHMIWIEGKDNYGVANAVLGNAPQMLQCDPPALPFPDGKRRWVPNLEAFAAWQFTRWDLAKPGRAVIDSVVDGIDLPLAPDLVRIADRPEVHVLDGTLLRHVRSPAVMKAWRFGFDKVRAIAEADAVAFTLGAAWPDAPFLVHDEESGKVYFIDKADPATPDSELDDTMVAGGCTTSRDTSALAAFLLLGVILLRRR